MIIEGKCSLLTRLALVALPVVMSGLVTGCIAQAGETGADDEPNALHEDRADDTDVARTKTDTPAEDEIGFATTATTGAPTGAGAAPSTSPGDPASPDPSEPQPSPWKPNGKSLGNAAQSTSPTATPQPSPWEGNAPPPNWPNAQTNGAQNTANAQ